MNLITKVLIIIGIALFTALGVYINANKKLKERLSETEINLKGLEEGVIQYKDKYGKLYTKSVQQEKEFSDLKQSNDSLKQELVSAAKGAGVKEKNISQVGQVKTTTKVETKILFIHKDTVYNLSKPDQTKNIIRLKGDTLYQELEIYNKQVLLWDTKKETIKPPYKFFIKRWFQKKHIVTRVIINNSNPLITTEDQHFYLIK